MQAESGLRAAALGMQERHAMVQSHLLGPRHPKLLNALLELAHFHITLPGGAEGVAEPQSHQTAARLLVDLIPKLKASFGPAHHRVQRALVLQGQAYHRLGLLKAAAASLEQALSLQVGEPAVRSPLLLEAERILETVQKLADLEAEPLPAFVDNADSPHFGAG